MWFAPSAFLCLPLLSYVLTAHAAPPGRLPKDLSPEPQRPANLTRGAYGGGAGEAPAAAPGGGEGQGGSWYDRPSLSVLYDSAVELSSPNESLQLYDVRVKNHGPGHICQLALSIDDWNTTRQWWGIDTLAGNKSYQYLPLYRSDVWPGEDWSFGFVQKRDNDTWPRVDPVFGETCDGRWFNATSIIPAPPNPAGTSASLTMTEGFGFYLPDGNKYVLYSGSVKNTGNTTISGVGVFIPNLFDSLMSWHLAFDPFTNATYLPLHRVNGLRPDEAEDFGVVTREVAADQPGFNLTHVSTRNQLWWLTAENLFEEGRTNFSTPSGNSSGRVVDMARGGRSVSFPPAAQQKAARGRSRHSPSNATTAGNATTANTTTAANTTTNASPGGTSDNTTASVSNSSTVEGAGGPPGRKLRFVKP